MHLSPNGKLVSFSSSLRRASALVTVCIFSAIILMIAGGSIASITYQTRSTGRSLAYKQSLALAEAGAEVALATLNTEGNTWAGWTSQGSNKLLSNVQLKDVDGSAVGTYSVTVIDAASDTPLVSSVGTTQIGSSGPVKREVRVPLKNNATPSPFGSYGIYSRNHISVKNSELDGKSAAEGNITINTTPQRIIGALQAAGTITVTKGNPDKVVQKSAPEAPPEFPDDALAAAKISNDNHKIYKIVNGKKASMNIPVSGAFDFTKHGEVFFPEGIYYLDKLEIGANTQIKVEGLVKIFLNPGTGKLAIGFDSGTNTLNAPGDAAKLQLFVKHGNIEFGSKFHAYCGIYAPNSDVHFSSNTWLTGALVANNISLESQSGIRTVQDLLQPESSAGYLALGWTEVAATY